MKFVLKRLDSFKYAFSGIWTMVKSEKNAQIHLFSSLFIISIGIIYQISKLEWYAIILCIALVWMAELLNTAIEVLADVVSPEIHPSIKTVKDIAAGAVLISAMASLIIGIMIFYPKI
ncbi:MAG: diacylglycerol kinase [Candidatus Cloacimonadota bacterium]|nr:MAG: diacylglycerol kinase [Candidatus Cloacimonadota bacterium]